MQINVSTRHGHLSADTQDKISSKAEKLSRFHEKISSIDITIDLKKTDHPDVEVCVAVDGTNGFVSKTSGSNLLGAVDGAVHKLEEQLRRHKEKTIDKHRDPARKHFVAEVDVKAEDEVDVNLEAE